MFNLLNQIKLPIFLLFISFFLGSIGYKLIYPDVDWLKIFFMVAITLATVGYGDILHVEDNPVALIYTCLLILLGMGVVLYAVSLLTAFVIEGKLHKIFIEERIHRRINKMQNHYIICGAGNTGKHVIREISITQHAYVVIDKNQEILESLKKEFPNVLCITGDSTDDNILLEANIKTAIALIATLSNDKDNLFLTITAKMQNPNLKIVSRAVDITMFDKLKNAGANYVVSPNLIGGLRIASEILRPNVVGFLDKMLRGTDKSVRIEEVTVLASCKYIGKSFQDIDLYNKTGVNILAYSLKNDFIYNPSNSTLIQENMILLAICTPNQRQKLESLLS